MKLTTKLFSMGGAKRRNKMKNQHAKGSEHRRGEYLINNKTPFEITESFRNLKATLSVSVPKKDNGGVSILVTSSYPEEGKTTVAVNLSLMFAQSNVKVVLIDADIRKGRVAKHFGEKSSPGLSDYLSGQKTLEEVVKQAPDSDNFYYISCGTRSPKPYELLESNAMKELLEKLRERYDYIIIDTPPVLLVSDSLALASMADGTVIVCRHLESYVSDIARTLNSLAFVKANVLGVIVNDYEDKVKKGYGYGGYKKYHYYSRYGYKYGYRYEYGSTSPEDTKAEDAEMDVAAESAEGQTEE